MFEYQIKKFLEIPQLVALEKSQEVHGEASESLEPNLDSRSDADICLVEGDLHLNETCYLSSLPHSLCVTGNMTVDGFLDNEAYRGLFVFGSLEAHNINFSQSFNFIDGKLKVNNALILSMNGETVVGGGVDAKVVIHDEDHSIFSNGVFLDGAPGETDKIGDFIDSARPQKVRDELLDNNSLSISTLSTKLRENQNLVILKS